MSTLAMIFSDDNGKSYRQVATGLSENDVAGQVFRMIRDGGVTVEREPFGKEFGGGYVAWRADDTCITRWVPES